jgi:hypothetical protein
LQKRRNCKQEEIVAIAEDVEQQRGMAVRTKYVVVVVYADGARLSLNCGH